MTAELTGLCRDHSFESAEDLCRRCGAEYCELCLVYPFGTARPFCKECAMAAGGVRSHVTRPAMPKKELRRRLKAFEERRNRSAAVAGGLDDPSAPVLHDPLAPSEEDLERVHAPAPAPAPVTVPDDGAALADELSAAFDAPPPPPPPPTDEPAEGVAPPIDWSQPFG